MKKLLIALLVLLCFVPVLGLAEDVTSSTLERLRIEHERDYDTLTGLYNRRAFQRICSDLFSEPEKLGHAALQGESVFCRHGVA